MFMKMHEIQEWISDAARRQGIRIRELSQNEAMEVQDEVTRRYVKVSTPCTWWWNLSRPIDESYDRNTVRLSSIIPTRAGSCWLIPDTEEEWLPVYELEMDQIEMLIDDCPGFEYYLVAKDFSWFIVETHHDQYYICRASDRLPEMTK